MMSESGEVEKWRSGQKYTRKNDFEKLKDIGL